MGANVVGMIDAISRLQIPINIVGVIASAENMISSNAMKPDDVLTALSGETVEMLNSDAEGRLVLGDAVFYANQFQPKIILDFATLTGVAVLGEDKATLFNSNADKEIEEIRVSAKEMDEYAFELPMTQTEQRLIRQSDVADLVNHTNGHGKALFLPHLLLILVDLHHISISILLVLRQLTRLAIKVQKAQLAV